MMIVVVVVYIVQNHNIMIQHSTNSKWHWTFRHDRYYVLLSLLEYY